MNVPTISPHTLHDLVQAGRDVELIDVRTPLEFREVHVSFARNEPLDGLNPVRLAAAPRPAGQPLYVICRSGNRARQACEKLHAAGCPNVINVEGGTLAWEQAGLPVVRGAKAISLERQVRIAAGSLVLIGALLGYFAHPYWIALAAFVGAGLVFAGITDTCGLGLLLARMPWNRVPRASSASNANATTERNAAARNRSTPCCG
jgi:rhodanese-related sulfurtransferase